MKGVTGEIYNDKGVACKFKSDRGAANNLTKTLTLIDRVQVDSGDPKATLQCDRLIYDGNRKFLKAQGHVMATGTMRTVGTIDEVWATPDLKKIATPDMFDLK